MEDPERPAMLDAHRLLVMWLFICTVIVSSLLIVVVIFFDTTGGGLTIEAAVMPAGAGGGFVSSLRRLYSFEDVFPRRAPACWVNGCRSGSANNSSSRTARAPPLISPPRRSYVRRRTDICSSW